LFISKEALDEKVMGQGVGRRLSCLVLADQGLLVTLGDGDARLV
jgi:hypothetical protein